MGILERSVADKNICFKDPNLEKYYVALDFDDFERIHGVKLDRRRSYLVHNDTIFVMYKVKGRRRIQANGTSLVQLTRKAAETLK